MQDKIRRASRAAKPPAGSRRQASAPSTSSSFSRNIARMVEEGGKALAAYLKPREDGTVKIEPADEIADVVKTLGHVAEYWLSDPQRAVEVQATLGKAYLELWAAAAKRMTGENGAAGGRSPIRGDKRFTDPEWSSNQFYDFLKQAYLLTTQWADRLVKNAQASTRTPATRPSSTSGRSRNAISPSNFVLTNPELMRETLARTPRIWCAACRCWRRTSRPARAT